MRSGYLLGGAVLAALVLLQCSRMDEIERYLHVDASDSTPTPVPTSSPTPTETPTTFTCSASTVDDYNLHSTHDAEAKAVSIDTSGNVFVTGYAKDGFGVKHLIVRKMSGSTGIWATSRQDQVTTGQDSEGFAIATYATNKIVAVGKGTNGSSHIVDLSELGTSAGASWSSESNDLSTSGTDQAFTAVAVNSSQQKIRSYYNTVSSFNTTWRVFQNVTQLEAFQLALSRPSIPRAITMVDDTHFYVAGSGEDASATHWLVRKTTDGSTFSTVDDFLYESTRSAWARAIAQGESGHIYVAGNSDSSASFRWIVRRTIDDGANWSTVRDYQLATTRYSIAYGIAFDGTSHMFAAGLATDSSNIAHWMVQSASTSDITTWTDQDDFQLASGKGSTANGIARDASGNLYVVGSGTDSGNLVHWIVRKIVCQTSRAKWRGK